MVIKEKCRVWIWFIRLGFYWCVLGDFGFVFIVCFFLRLVGFGCCYFLFGIIDFVVVEFYRFLFFFYGLLNL